MEMLFVLRSVGIEMEAGENFSHFKNSRGSVFIGVLFLGAALSIISVGILNQLDQSKSIKQQKNFKVVADKLRDAVIYNLESKVNWEKTIQMNQDTFERLKNKLNQPGAAKEAQFDSNESSGIDLYDANTNQVIFNTLNPTQGFSNIGIACNEFSLSQGNNSCPYRYEMQLTRVKVVNSHYFFSVRANLFFSPKDKKMAFNTQKFHSFEYDFQSNLKSINKACEVLGGVVDGAGNCTRQITVKNNECEVDHYFTGSSLKSNPCVTAKLAVKRCPAGQFLYGVNSENQATLCRSF